MPRKYYVTSEQERGSRINSSDLYSKNVELQIPSEKINHPDGGFPWYSVYPGVCRNNTLLRPRPIPSEAFPVD